MLRRFGACALFGFLAVAVSASAQTSPSRHPVPPDGTVKPDQPVRPQVPTLVPRGTRQPAARPTTPEPPFRLTPQQSAQVDRILNLWEQRNEKVKTFDCRFKRWIYDVVFGRANQPKFIESGTIKYASPDRGLFRIETTEKNGKEVAIEDSRAEHWISDGKSIFEFNPVKKQVIEHKLPKELQGKAIANSPLPFLFGAKAKKLKERYFIRIVTPRDVQNQIWLEAYPRHQQDAANFRRARFVITTQGMSPYALEIVQPNGKDFTRYQFYDIVVNDSWRMFKGDPFRAFTPRNWQAIVEESPTAQAHRAPGGPQR